MNVSIAPLSADDEAAFLQAVARSRTLHGDWVQPPRDHAGFQALLTKAQGEGHVCYLARTSEGELVGCINLNEIVRGVFLSTYLGYYAFAPLQGKGLMRAALAAAVEQAFGPLGLHRVEANVQPGNTRSIALLRSLGFRYEGTSPNYLRIAGAWREHARYALTTEDDFAGA